MSFSGAADWFDEERFMTISPIFEVCLLIILFVLFLCEKLWSPGFLADELETSRSKSGKDKKFHGLEESSIKKQAESWIRIA